jgi:hypothetical protein
MNYFGQKALWEFMENVESTSPPTAPSKEVALETSAAIVENQMEQPPVVQSVTQGPETIVVQPTVIQTPEGPTVQTPTVVVAPAIVTNEQGETMLIKPDVTVVEIPPQQPTPTAVPVVAPEQQSAVEAVSTLAAAAASEQPASPQVVAELAQTATAAATSTEAKEAVDQLAQQAVKAEAAPTQEIKITAMTAIQDISGQQPVQQAVPEAGCYPIRRYDMSKVSAFSFNDSYGAF